MTNIVSEIDEFLASTGMKPTAFGDRVMRDRHLVRQLRNGRRIWPETEQKIRIFMAEYKPESATA
jgi:hypothetical protein